LLTADKPLNFKSKNKSPKSLLGQGRAQATKGYNMKTGSELIAIERARQIEKEKWSAKHDDKHTDQSLALAAALYASPIPLFEIHVSGSCVQWLDPWPWEYGIEPPRGGPEIKTNAWDKRKDHPKIKRLIIAGALIAAEIDRLNRKGEK